MKKRIFISFAAEDIRLRDLLVGQARNNNCPFEITVEQRSKAVMV